MFHCFSFTCIRGYFWIYIHVQYLYINIYRQNKWMNKNPCIPFIGCIPMVLMLSTCHMHIGNTLYMSHFDRISEYMNTTSTWAVFKTPVGWWLLWITLPNILGTIIIQQRHPYKPTSIMDAGFTFERWTRPKTLIVTLIIA